MHPAVIEAWICDLVPEQLPLPAADNPLPESQTAQSLRSWCKAGTRSRVSSQQLVDSTSGLNMNDGSPEKQPRRSQRAKAARTTASTAPQLAIRPPPPMPGSPVTRSGRRTTQSQKSSTSDGTADLDLEVTPRPPRQSIIRTNTSTAATSAHYSRSLSDHHTIFDRPPLPSSRSSASKESSTSRRSTSPVKTVAALRDAGVEYQPLEGSNALLGDAGHILYQDLVDISNMVGVFPADIFEEIQVATRGTPRIHELYKNNKDSRSRDELLHELSEIQTIKDLSVRCSKEKEGEAEWNSAVHSAVLRLALGTNDPVVGWRYITNAKIDPRYLPLKRDGLTTSSKMVDYALFIGDDEYNVSPSRNERLDLDIAKVVTESIESINHISYLPLRCRPILLGIETKTIARTELEAHIQLGIWIASHVRRIWSLSCGLSPEKTNRLKETLLEMVFPLIFVQSDKWCLMFARLYFKPESHENFPFEVVIYHDVEMGRTASIGGIYQLLQAIQVVRKWGDEVFRKWWKTILNTVS